MVRNHRFLLTVAVSAFVLLAPLAGATPGVLVPNNPGANKHDPNLMERCRGSVSLVNDAGVEGVRTTNWNFNMLGGGGETGRFDPVALLTTRVDLQQGCLNAHFSAIVGSAQTYPNVSPITFFQVTLSLWDPATMTWGPPQHMYGHYETPYGIYGPAVMIESERDVDTFGANFFARIGNGPYDFPPGTYRVDVWWAGGPAAPGGAIGAGFVLKLYQ